MEDLKSLINQLTAAGITPKVNISVSPDTTDIEAIKALNSELQAQGITPEVHINLGLGSVPGPGMPTDVTGEKSLTVMVNDDKINLFTFKARDDAGKPILIPREPRIHLFRNQQFKVSAERRESTKDAGDGIIIGTGGLRVYFVVDCPPNPEAVGLYVKQSDVAVLA